MLKKEKGLTPAQIVLAGFMGLILVGAFLLTLPISSANGAWTPFLNALFTATSATCVTGLVVYDTATYWSGFGQTVIILLIQIGGLGIVTMLIAMSVLSKKKIGLKQRWVMQESISAPQLGGIVKLTGFIIKTAFLIELVGILLLSLRFCPEFGLARGIWYGIFHSISAFCNAGFDLMGINGAFSSLTDFKGDVLVNLVISFLIIIGGIGFLTWHDMRVHGVRFKKYRLQSKIILVTTLLLILGGFFFFLYEFGQPQWEDMTWKERILASLFQSVTPRTAGFNTVNLTMLSQPALLILILLMLVGGSPGSTAGGFKTTTLAAMFLSVRAAFRKWANIKGFKRRIPGGVFVNAGAIFTIYLFLFLTGGILICYIDNVSLLSALFETASAVGTVGLTVGITPELSSASKMILIILMYFGRVGGLTLLYSMGRRRKDDITEMPEEKIAIG